MLGGILFPVADRPSAVATDREGKPAAAAGPRAGEANGGGAVRLVEERGATVVGEPAVLALVRRGLRPNRSPLNPDSPGQQLAAGGGWACSRFSQVPQGLVAVTLEAPSSPFPYGLCRPSVATHASSACLPPARGADFSGLDGCSAPCQPHPRASNMERSRFAEEDLGPG